MVTGRFLRVMSAGSLICASSFLPGIAQSDAMTIINDNVGVGTDAPDAALHIYRDGGLNPSLVLESAGGSGPSKWEIKSNPNTGRLTFKDLNGSTTPFKFGPDAIENLLRVGIPSNNTVSISGNLVVAGNCTEQNGACADYVFAADYPLKSLEELDQFIQKNQHLPNVPSAAEMQENGVNITHLSGRLLEKIEELTLYTLEQQKTITDLQLALQAQTDRINRLESNSGE